MYLWNLKEVLATNMQHRRVGAHSCVGTYSSCSHALQQKAVLLRGGGGTGYDFTSGPVQQARTHQMRSINLAHGRIVGTTARPPDGGKWKVIATRSKSTTWSELRICIRMHNEPPTAEVTTLQ